MVEPDQVACVAEASLTERQRELADCIRRGATLTDFIVASNAVNGVSERDCRIIAQARDSHHCDGEVEIDDLTLVSGTDLPHGDYVLAWVWSEIEPDVDEAENDEDDVEAVA